MVRRFVVKAFCGKGRLQVHMGQFGFGVNIQFFINRLQGASNGGIRYEKLFGDFPGRQPFLSKQGDIPFPWGERGFSGKQCFPHSLYTCLLAPGE